MFRSVELVVFGAAFLFAGCAAEPVSTEHLPAVAGTPSLSPDAYEGIVDAEYERLAATYGPPTGNTRQDFYVWRRWIADLQKLGP